MACGEAYGVHTLMTAAFAAISAFGVCEWVHWEYVSYY